MALDPCVAFSVGRYARVSNAISMVNVRKWMDRIEEAIKNLK
jgi:hypothetical protein